MIPSPSENKLIPPNNSIISKFNGSKLYLFLLGIVVAIKNQFNLLFPF
uniref:Uncharacterized protein n=1 Tax=Rhizophora mucronata TaxID=61149 RepID=A0A2P2QR53_RHIMU